MSQLESEMEAEAQRAMLDGPRRENAEFAASVVGKVLLHVPTLFVGTVAKAWDGDAEKYVSAVNGLEVLDPVIEFEGGASMVAVRANFIALELQERHYFEALQKGFAGVLAVAARSAAASGVNPRLGFALTVSALRAQLREMEAKPVPGEAVPE